VQLKYFGYFRCRHKINLRIAGALYTINLPPTPTFVAFTGAPTNEIWQLLAGLIP
jgi:hypothetical protein